MKTDDFTTLKLTGKEIYLVVVEKQRLGFVVKTFGSLLDAESFAIGLITEITPFGRNALNKMIRLYRPMISYQINGNTHTLTKAFSSHNSFYFEAYVVPVNNFSGGINFFIKEREHCSEFFSYGDHFKRYYRAIGQFKDFGFLAN